MEKLLAPICAILFVLLLNVAYAAHCNVRTNCIGKVCKPSKLFVFGDSFVDTGNLPNIGREVTRSWYYPYGIAFHRRSTGRFSNGKCQTDFLASQLGIRAPITYKDRRFAPRSPYGMNFAYGGAGVFPAKLRQPTLGQQVSMLQDLIKDHVFTQCDIQDSVALVAISGNDYAGLAATEHNVTLIGELVGKATEEMGRQLKRLRDMGVPKIIVNNMHPLGCVPYMTRSRNYSRCGFSGTFVAAEHNSKLRGAVNRLHLGGTSSDAFLVLDLYSTFKSLVEMSVAHEPVIFKHRLDPCCESFDALGYCGQVDDNGDQMYTLCTNPGAHFYWDSVHPTQAGWSAAMYLLTPAISKFLGF